MKFNFKQMLEVSAFYLEKQKSFIPKKEYFLSRSQYQNIKALFTDPIFSDGFEYYVSGLPNNPVQLLYKRKHS